MKNIKKLAWITALFLIIGNKSFTQKTTYTEREELFTSSYSDLENKIKRHKNETEKAMLYAKTWISKAKSEQNWQQAVNAYIIVLHLNPQKHLPVYADSLLKMAKKTNDDVVVGKAYLTAGIMKYDQKEIKSALDYYLVADQYIARTNDEYSKHKIKYAIAQTKFYLGFYEEAIALLNECLKYFEDENDRGYINTIHSLGLCYNKLGKYDLTSYYNELGIKQSMTLEMEDMIMYFEHSEAINDYGKQEYIDAITKLKELLPVFLQKRDPSSLTTIYFYLGKCYWSTNEHAKAIPYFLKVDHDLDVKISNRPELRENYELLIRWYKQNNDLDLQLIYINKLIEVDKVLTKNYKYLSRKIYKEYDTKELIKEKAAIEAAMEIKSKIHYAILTLFAGVLIFFIVKQYRNKKKYEKRFEDVMQNHTIKKNIINNKNESLDMNPGVIQMVLKKLEKFEKNKKFLDKDINLIKLATILNTNSKYASKIIAKHRGKGTIDYITDLKLEYIIELLKTERKFRNYTNQALAEEAGFGSTQKFTRAFKNRTDISPTYFVEKLNQQEAV